MKSGSTLSSGLLALKAGLTLFAPRLTGPLHSFPAQAPLLAMSRVPQSAHCHSGGQREQLA